MLYAARLGLILSSLTKGRSGDFGSNASVVGIFTGSGLKNFLKMISIVAYIYSAGQCVPNMFLWFTCLGKIRSEYN